MCSGGDTPSRPDVAQRADVPLMRLALALHRRRRVSRGANHRMSNQERGLPSETDWRELIVSLLVAAAIGMFTVYGLVYFMGAMM